MTSTMSATVSSPTFAVKRKQAPSAPSIYSLFAGGGGAATSSSRALKDPFLSSSLAASRPPLPSYSAPPALPRSSSYTSSLFGRRAPEGGAGRENESDAVSLRSSRTATTARTVKSARTARTTKTTRAHHQPYDPNGAISLYLNAPKAPHSVATAPAPTVAAGSHARSNSQSRSTPDASLHGPSSASSARAKIDNRSSASSSSRLARSSRNFPPSRDGAPTDPPSNLRPARMVCTDPRSDLSPANTSGSILSTSTQTNADRASTTPAPALTPQSMTTAAEVRGDDRGDRSTTKSTRITGGGTSTTAARIREYETKLTAASSASSARASSSSSPRTHASADRSKRHVIARGKDEKERELEVSLRPHMTLRRVEGSSSSSKLGLSATSSNHSKRDRRSSDEGGHTAVPVDGGHADTAPASLQQPCGPSHNSSGSRTGLEPQAQSDSLTTADSGLMVGINDASEPGRAGPSPSRAPSVPKTSSKILTATSSSPTKIPTVMPADAGPWAIKVIDFVRETATSSHSVEAHKGPHAKGDTSGARAPGGGLTSSEGLGSPSALDASGSGTSATPGSQSTSLSPSPSISNSSASSPRSASPSTVLMSPTLSAESSTTPPSSVRSSSPRPRSAGSSYFPNNLRIESGHADDDSTPTKSNRQKGNSSAENSSLDPQTMAALALPRLSIPITIDGRGSLATALTAQDPTVFSRSMSSTSHSTSRENLLSTTETIKPSMPRRKRATPTPTASTSTSRSSRSSSTRVNRSYEEEEEGVVDWAAALESVLLVPDLPIELTSDVSPEIASILNASSSSGSSRASSARDSMSDLDFDAEDGLIPSPHSEYSARVEFAYMVDAMNPGSSSSQHLPSKGPRGARPLPSRPTPRSSLDRGAPSSAAMARDASAESRHSNASTSSSSSSRRSPPVLAALTIPPPRVQVQAPAPPPLPVPSELRQQQRARPLPANGMQTGPSARYAGAFGRAAIRANGGAGPAMGDVMMARWKDSMGATASR